MKNAPPPGVSIADLLSRFRPRSLLIVPPANQERLVADELLQIPSVSGLVLRLRDDELAQQYPGKVGWFEGSHAITLPPVRANTLLSLLDWPFPSPPIVQALRASGIRSVGHALSGQSRFHREPIRERGIYRLWRRIRTMRRDLIVRPISPPDDAAAGEPYWRWSLESLHEAFPAETNDQRNGMLIFIPTLDAGGSQRQAVYTAVNMHKRGYAVSICVSRNVIHRPYLEMLHKEGVECFLLPPFSLANTPARILPILNALVERGNLANENLIEVIQTASAITKRRPQCVYSWLDWSNTTAGLAAALVGVPRIILGGRSMSPEWFDLHQTFMRPIYELLAASPATKLVNNSAAGAADYMRWLQTSEPPTVIANGFDQSDFAIDPTTSASMRLRYSIPENAPVVCGILRLSEEKRPELWIRIADLVGRSNADCHFLLVGDGPMAGHVAEAVINSPVRSRIHLIGVMPNPSEALAISSCLLLTSRMEGLPNVLIEAQALGVPVVTSAVGGAPETLEESVTGFAIASDNPEPYAEAILHILKDSGWAVRAQQRGPALVRERFSINRMIDETLKVYGHTP